MKTTFRPFQTTPIVANKQLNTTQDNTKVSDGKFAQVLERAIYQTSKELTISKHAKHRLEQRDIKIDSQLWKQIEAKVGEAKKMGVNDSLVLLENAALIVNAKNNVVVTAMGRDEATTQIFTNINGTIIL